MTTQKLTVLTSFSGEGGVERMVLNLTNEFARQGLQVDLLALKMRSAYLDQFPDNVRCLPLRARHSTTCIPELVKYLRRERPRAMLVAKDRPGRAALLARSLAGVQTRIVIRLGTNLSAALAHRHGPQRWLRRFPMRRGYRPVDRIVAVSEGVADDTRVITGLPAERICVIRNPVVTEAFLNQSAQSVHHPWLENKEYPVILAAGRLTVQKDFTTLVNAFARVLREQPAKLVILGEGKQRAGLEALIDELGVADHVDLPGFTNNPWAWMKQADLFVLSSRWEGSPNVLTEAIALGTPVVSTDCPSGPRELLENGRYGPLVPVGDAAALAKAIVATIHAPPAAEILRSAAKEYTAEQSARHYLEALFPNPNLS